MTRYLISFDDGAMNIAEEDLPAVGKAAHEVVQQAKQAGVWIFGGGVEGHEASVVDTNGSVAQLPYPRVQKHIGGFVIVDVASHEEALAWAARFAAACRCAQEVRPLMYDPEV